MAETRLDSSKIYTHPELVMVADTVAREKEIGRAHV